MTIRSSTTCIAARRAPLSNASALRGPRRLSRVQASSASQEASIGQDGSAGVSRGFKALILATIVGANAAGLSIWAPHLLHVQGLTAEFAQVAHHNFFLNILASFYTSMGLLSILALRSPLKFAPLFVLQLCYKAIWLLTTALPGLVAGRLTTPQIGLAAVFVVHVVMDVLFIPWKYILGRK